MDTLGELYKIFPPKTIARAQCQSKENSFLPMLRSVDCGNTPIYWSRSAYKGHTEIVEILAPFTDNLNAPDENGCTLIYRAAVAQNGHTEIVKIMAQQVMYH